MIRFTAPPVLLVTCAVVPIRAAPPEKEPDKDQLAVIAKTFCVAMRNHHGDKNANALRAYFDPRYLKTHGLTDRDLSVQVAGVGDILGIHVADDGQTVLCVVETRANPNDKEPVKEAILLRASAHEGKVYLSPPKPPDPKTGSFAPWILRTKL